MSETITIVTNEGARGNRIDLHLAQHCPALSLSRSRIQDLIREGHITIGGAHIKVHHKLTGREVITIVIPERKPLDLLPTVIPLQILYEDQDLIVIDKPAGLVVHPAPGNLEGTLVNALLHHCTDLSGIGGVERPGIVHRLDKFTSGVMVAAKNDNAHRQLSKQIKTRKVKKIYLAIVRGELRQESGTIETPIGRHEQHRKKMTIHAVRGRTATTHYRVKERFQGYSLLRLELKTGRTHQIRVHLSSIHHPIVGDPLYGGKHYKTVESSGKRLTVQRQMLHARRLGFTHPRTNAFMEFKAPTPKDMHKVIHFLRTGSENGDQRRAGDAADP